MSFHVRRILGVAMALCLCLQIPQAFLMKVEAITPTYSVSSALESYNETITTGEYTLTLQVGEERRYGFTPEEDGIYAFYTPFGEEFKTEDVENGIMTYYKRFQTDIRSIDGGGCGAKFFYRAGTDGYVGYYCEMKAGTTYLLIVRPELDYGGELTENVTLEKLPDTKSITLSVGYTHDTGNVYVGDRVIVDCVPESVVAISENITWSSDNDDVLELQYVTWIEDEAVFTAIAPGKATVTVTLSNGVTASREIIVLEKYEITEGTYEVVDIGNGEDFSIRVNAPVEKFVGVAVHGKVISEENYTVTEGSTIVTLHADYLATLEDGGLFVEIIFTDGGAEALLTLYGKPTYLSGDVNGDGKVNGKDGVLLAQYLAGRDVTIITDAADVNGDGKINGKDGVILAQYLAGWGVILHGNV